MGYGNIDASLTAADVQEIKDAFTTILEKLPFLVNLTVEERKATFKTGADRMSFVHNAATTAQGNPTLFPESFNSSALKKDFDLFLALTELRTLAASIASRIDDTRLAVGGEAMRQATQVYHYIKEAAKTTPGLKPVAEELGEAFRKATKKSNPDEP